MSKVEAIKVVFISVGQTVKDLDSNNSCNYALTVPPPQILDTTAVIVAELADTGSNAHAINLSGILGLAKGKKPGFYIGVVKEHNGNTKADILRASFDESRELEGLISEKLLIRATETIEQLFGGGAAEEATKRYVNQ